MVNKNLREVSFIDGEKEFYINETITELLSQNSNIFPLREKPEKDSIIFTGDVTLFKIRVYKEEDLDLEGSYYIYKESNGSYTLKINSNLKTKTTTFTYITYNSETATRVQGLYSVNYERGILYTSTPIKNVRISYKCSAQYYTGKEMLQNNFNTYSNNTIEDNQTEYVYQIQDKSVNDKEKELIETPRVILITTGDNYEL